MGARHSKKSMDVTTTPKKDGVPAEGGDAAVVGDGKLERIEEADIKPTTNGTGPHTETTDDKDVIKDKDTVTEKEKEKEKEKDVVVVEKEETEKKVNSVGPKIKHLFSFKKSSSDNKDDKDKEKDKDKETVTEKETEKEANDEKKEVVEAKVEETKSETPAETPVENAETATTPTEETPASPTTATSPDTKEAKKKDKPKKKWSIRSISFSKKDKPKPVREEAAKNGDVTKEETLAEGGEEAENATATSPAEDKSIVPSPTETEAAPAPAAEAEKSVVEKNETPSSPTDPTPVPSEETKDGDNEKIEKKVEVSPVETAVVMPSKTKPIITTSVMSRKTSEEFPSQFPSSPPSTPIDPSPFQQAQQTPANATALAEALKLPAETIKSSENIIIDQVKNDNVDIVIKSEEEQVPVTPEIVKKIEIEIETTPVTSIEKNNDNDDIKNDNVIEEKIKNTDMPIEVEEKIINIINVEEETPVLINTKIENENIDDKIIEEKIIQVEAVPVLNTQIENNKIEIVEKNEILESPLAPSTASFEEIETPQSDGIDEIPPPLPESPIPLPKASTDLLNFMSSQIADVPVVTEEIIIKENNKEEIDVISSLLVEKKEEIIVKENGQEDIETIPPPIEEDNQEIIDESDDLEDLPPPPEEQISNNQADSILTPPRSPSPTDLPPPIVDTSFIMQNGDKNHKLNTDDISKDLHVKAKHNGDIINIDQCPITILKNDQNSAELEAVVEKTKEVTKTETVEAPKVSPPSVPVEAPVSSVPAAPVITEDVASVTQAIEEIDINEKAVAAAVNENIEAVKTNEIIADMNHQNTLKE